MSGGFEPGAEGDALATGDDRGGVLIQPRAVVVDGIDHDVAELRRRGQRPSIRFVSRRLRRWMYITSTWLVRMADHRRRAPSASWAF
jgi:hypothetical protein